MDKQSAERLITNTFDYPFDIGKYKLLSRNIFKEFEEAEFSRHGTYIPEAFRSHIKKYERLGKYEDVQGRGMDILIVYIKEGLGLDRARTLQRNFISNYLDDTGKDAALVAFTTSDMEDWRFSLITIEYKTIQDESGKIKTKKVLSSAKRFSFLVGKNEANHTAQQQVIPLLTNSNTPSIEDLEQAFSVEQVTDAFYQDYKKRFLELGDEINRVLDKDEKIKREFEIQNINTDNFAKKLMGQIVFLYFVQKKGWLGVGKDDDGNFLKWGEGDKKFMRLLFEKKFCEYDNCFNDVLEPLFYEALATERANNYYSKFGCKIPFLSGGLFEPMNGYNWQETDITISNNVIEMILDTFDRYNFTVKEDDPLDKEVAIDPEMLGKVFENLLPENLRKGNGAYYTPRPIVHYMCQESLINYLDTHLDIDKNGITLLVKEGEAVVEHDKIANTKEEGYDGKYQLRMPSSIIDNAAEIDKLLTYVKICDPAIGSGAFPMGLLHEIVVARNVLTTYIGNEQSRTKYHLKEDCIQNSIYGVDIDEGAIEISKLRLWLSLIVDEDDIENIKPLPNLDYKIMCGNSLISRYELDSPIDVVFSEFNKKVKSKDYNNKAIRDLVGNQEVDLKFYKKLTNDFLTESSHNKKIIFRELIGEIKNAFKTELEDKDRQKLSDTRGALANLSRIDIFGEQVGAKTEISKAKKKLEELEKQKQEIQDGALYENAVEWRFEFPNLLNDRGVFIGFDIVIANPPYLGEDGNKHIFRPVAAANLSKFYQGKMDLFYFFFHLSLDVCKGKGETIFITTNYYPTASGAKLLRSDFSNRAIIRKLINFSEFRVFESALGQHNMITSLQKSNDENYYSENCETKRKGVANSSDLYSIMNSNDLDTEYYRVKQKDLYEGEHLYIRIFGSGENSTDPKHSVLNKMKDNSTDILGNLCEISQGVVSGCDKYTRSLSKKCKSDNHLVLGQGIYIFDYTKEMDTHTVNEFTKEESQLLYDFYKNSDIDRYQCSSTPSKSILYLDKNIDTISNFSNVKLHLERFKDILIDRREVALGRLKYFHLQWARKKTMFFGEKIVVPYRSKVNTFAYNNIEWFCRSDCYIIKSKTDVKLKFILPILNSKLYFFWLYHKGKRKGDILELFQTPLSEIPIKVVAENIQQKFVLLADKIIDGKKNEEDTKVLEHKVDVMVYKLYELTYEEALIVDEAFAMSEVEYNNFVL